MKRLREVKKYGNSFVIKLYTSDILDFKINEGDLIDINDICVSRLIKKRRIQNE